MSNLRFSGPRIVVALDFAQRSDVQSLCERLDPKRCRVKVGKELFTRVGPDIVADLVSRGFDVFLDLKFHDIPATVAKACRAAADLGVWMLNVHALGGSAMLAAARGAIPNTENSPLLIAVTVLTSMDANQLNEVGLGDEIEPAVLRLAHLAQDAGLDGVVCSAAEAGVLRNACGRDFCLVTPGIRPKAAAHDDQIRVVTPAEAITDGSDFLVIGRPITQAPDPMGALLAIEQEIAPLLKRSRKP